MDPYHSHPVYGGCFFTPAHHGLPTYLPQLSLKAHAIVQSSAARTTLSRIFVNSSEKLIKEASYKFPLYDGVSVVEFDCKVGNRILHSSVKSKSEANTIFEDAVAKKQSAAILDHISQSDVFLIRLGNIPVHEQVSVNITFVEELKQDAQTDGTRYTLPHGIAPRYGTQESLRSTDINLRNLPLINDGKQGMSVTVDVVMNGSFVIRELESPSHQIKISLGRNSSLPESETTFDPSKASAFLKARGDSDEVFLERDFVLLIKADGLDAPSALLETHPTIPNQRAIMATLVPKFSLPSADSEIVFLIDRSGSMHDKILTLQSALRVLLKSIPVGMSFNICSFGNHYSFLWPTSRAYNASSLKRAMEFVDTVDADMGGTEIEQALIATVAKRLDGKNLEVLVLTDGQVYDQQALFDFVREKAANKDARFFSLGIGYGASHALIEGIARAGNGFCQSVLQHEELNRKVVRMLKGALTPHIHDYKLEVKYDGESDGGFEHMDATDLASETEHADEGDSTMEEPTDSSPKPISLFDKNFKDHDMDANLDEAKASEELPNLTRPSEIQAPYNIPPLYPMNRTTVYLLMDPQTSGKTPTSILLSGTSKQGPLSLKIPIHDIGIGKTIHQLASRKAVIELEEQSGWLCDAKDEQGIPFKNLHLTTQQRLTERECQGLGIKFQVTGKYCSFVAVEESTRSASKHKSPSMLPVEIGSAELSDAIPHQDSPYQSLREEGSVMHARRFQIHRGSRDGGSRSGGGRGGGSWGGGLRGGGLRGGGLRGGGLRGGGLRGGGLRGGGLRGGGLRGGGLRGGGRGGAQVAPTNAMGASEPHYAMASEHQEMNFPQAQQLMHQRMRLRQVQLQQMQLQQYQSSAILPTSDNPWALSSQHMATPNPAIGGPEDLQGLVREQTYEGSWLMSNKLFELMNCDRKKIIEDVSALYAGSFGEVSDDFPCGDQSTLVATLLVMGYLENEHYQTRASWELVNAKAAEWVANKLEVMKSTVAGRVLNTIRHQISELTSPQ